MRKSILVGAIWIVFGCQSPEQSESVTELELQNELNRLEQEAATKDSSITHFLRSLNEIEDNLALIREKENLVTINTQPSTEFNENQRELIIDDLKLINALMDENRNKLAILRQRLRSANLKIDEFEKVIERLNGQLVEKDAEIRSLREELSKVNIMLSKLYTAYNERLEEKAEQEEALTTAWYVLGTFKELKENQVVTKEGGFIGLGGIKKLKENFNRDYFTQINIEETTEIKLFGKKSRLITHHPVETYELVEEEPADKLIINDPAGFWSVSKYLVVVVE